MFDGIEDLSYVPNGGHENLRRLACLLRQEHKDFGWDFSMIRNDCGTAGCAIGLALHVWPEFARAATLPNFTIEWFGLFSASQGICRVPCSGLAATSTVSPTLRWRRVMSPIRSTFTWRSLMPFDGHSYGRLDRGRLAQLAVALRQPMPKDFHWAFDAVSMPVADYCRGFSFFSFPKGACGTAGCALGLACELWPDFNEAYDKNRVDDTSLIDMPPARAAEIFAREYDGYGWKVPPGKVADAIEQYLKETEDAV